MGYARPAIVAIALASMGVPVRAQMTLQQDDRYVSYRLTAEGTGGDFVSGRRVPRDPFEAWSASIEDYAESYPAGSGFDCFVSSSCSEQELRFSSALDAGAGVSYTGGMQIGSASARVTSEQGVAFSVQRMSRFVAEGNLSTTDDGSECHFLLRRTDAGLPTLLRVDASPIADVQQAVALQQGEYEVVAYSRVIVAVSGDGVSRSGTADFNITVTVSCYVDFDGSGSLDVFDFLAYQTAFDAGEAIADLDGDGTLTIFDFLAFSNAFEDGCD